jgi:hypothetical protein
MSTQANLKPETIFFILRAFSESISGKEGEKGLAQVFRSNLSSYFGIPESGLPLKSLDIMIGSQTGPGIQAELQDFFEKVCKKLLKKHSEFATLQHILCLNEILECELEFPKYKIVEMVQRMIPEENRTNLLGNTLSLDGACQEIIGNILSPNWEESVNITCNQLVLEQVEQEVLDQDFYPDFKLISTNLFVGGFVLAITAGISSQTNVMAWILGPFVILGLVVTVLFATHHRRASATLFTALSTLLLATLISGGLEATIPAVKLLGFTGVGAILGSLLGIYRGLTQWGGAKNELIEEFRRQRISEVLSHQYIEPDQLLRFYNESFLPRWLKARTLVASRLNEVFTIKDRISIQCQNLKQTEPSKDFDRFFELHKSLNEIEVEMTRLDKLYDGMKTLEFRLKDRIDLLQNEARNQGNPVLEGKGLEEVYLRLMENETVLSNRAKERSMQRRQIFVTQLTHIENFLRFEVQESKVSNLEQWSRHSPELLSHIQSSAA